MTKNITFKITLDFVTKFVNKDMEKMKALKKELRQAKNNLKKENTSVVKIYSYKT